MLVIGIRSIRLDSRLFEPHGSPCAPIEESQGGKGPCHGRGWERLAHDDTHLPGEGRVLQTLGHPARIRVLEVLRDGERPVSELIPEVGIEASHLSQQLGVMRRAGIIQSARSERTSTTRWGTEALRAARCGEANHHRIVDRNPGAARTDAVLRHKAVSVTSVGGISPADARRERCSA